MDRPLKQRLWGAAVLIALAVIFLPILLKGPAPDSGVADVPIDAPPKPDAAGITTQELPLDVPGAAAGTSATGMPAPQPGSQLSTPAPAAPAVSPQQAAAGDYAVEFGSYGSAEDAARVVQALQGIKLRGYSEPVTVDGRSAMRVRIGPFSSRDAAEIARVSAGQLNSSAKSKVITLDAVNASASPVAATSPTAATPLPAAQAVSTPAPAHASTPSAAPVAATPTAPKTLVPAAPPTPKPVVAAQKPAAVKPAEPPHTQREAPKPAAKPIAEATAAAKEAAKDAAKPEPQPAAKPAAASTGFAVQLGAFANAAEATALRDRARAAGFTATTDTVQTEKGKLTRVRLGPVASREAAESLRNNAQAKLGMSGIVRSMP